jgi:hypothetical protein
LTSFFSLLEILYCLFFSSVIYLSKSIKLFELFKNSLWWLHLIESFFENWELVNLFWFLKNFCNSKSDFFKKLTFKTALGSVFVIYIHSFKEFKSFFLVFIFDAHVNGRLFPIVFSHQWGILVNFVVHFW